MGLFGWSYPPGAANDPNAPYNQTDGPCELCGLFEDKCICPECPVCGDRGNPRCYTPVNEKGCGQTKTQAQIDSLKEQEKKWDEQNRAEAEAEKHRLDEMDPNF